MITPITDEAYKLLHQGVIALAQVEANGIKVDEKYIKTTIKEIKENIIQCEEDIKKDKVYKAWRKRYGDKFNLNSTAQLGKVLFSDLGYTPTAVTKTGKPKTDEDALSNLDIEFIHKYLHIKKLKKVKSTYLKGILRETDKGFLHPVYNLHLVSTFRGSCDSPNFQNMPIRNPEMGKIVRQCFLPRGEDRNIVEVDYSGIEVHTAAWYHKDPVMLDYIHNPDKDMHRDMAQQCYALSDDEMTAIDKTDAKRIKNIRYCGKNCFVFPQFYGSWYMNCAPSLWENIDKLQLKTRDGLSIKKHLAKKGITKLGSLDYKKPPLSGTFIKHIKEVEYDFWNRRFKKYKQWKETWYDQYKKTGQFTSLTGFTISENLKKNEAVNYPIQGVGFHCLLWSLIRIQKLIKKYKMGTLIIGQIHDSIVADVPTNELNDYLQLVNKVMTVDIKKHWKWIITPLEIEAEVAPAGKSWYEKKEVKINI